MEMPEFNLPEGASLDMFKFAHHSTLMGGLLPDDPRAHACWYYCICAHKNISESKEGALWVGENDNLIRLNNIARAIALQYNLESPDEFLKFMGHCRLEAARCNIGWDSRIEAPFNEAFIRMRL